MFDAVELTEGFYDTPLGARIWPYFQLSFIDAQTLCKIRRYPYAGAVSRYLLAGCKGSGAKRLAEAVRLSRKIVFFVPRMIADE